MDAKKLEHQQVLEAEQKRLEESQPQLKKGLDAFLQNYAAYEKMAQQFRAPHEVKSAAQVFKQL